MDPMIVLASVFGVADLLLWRKWILERTRRRHAETHAGQAIRERQRLVAALERKAPAKTRGPVVISTNATEAEMHAALQELRGRVEPTNPLGGAA